MHSGQKKRRGSTELESSPKMKTFYERGGGKQRRRRGEGGGGGGALLLLLLMLQLAVWGLNGWLTFNDDAADCDERRHGTAWYERTINRFCRIQSVLLLVLLFVLATPPPPASFLIVS